MTVSDDMQAIGCGAGGTLFAKRGSAVSQSTIQIGGTTPILQIGRAQARRKPEGPR